MSNDQFNVPPEEDVFIVYSSSYDDPRVKLVSCFVSLLYLPVAKHLSASLSSAFSLEFLILEHKDVMTLENSMGHTCISDKSFVNPIGTHFYLFFVCSWEDFSLAPAYITFLFIQYHSSKPAGEQQCHFFISAAETSAEMGGFVMGSISAERTHNPSQGGTSHSKMNTNTKSHSHYGRLLGLNPAPHGML